MSRQTICKSGLCNVGILFLVLFTSTMTVHGATLTVKPGGGGDATTINGALEMLNYQDFEPDLVLVDPGLYDEQLTPNGNAGVSSSAFPAVSALTTAAVEASYSSHTDPLEIRGVDPFSPPIVTVQDASPTSYGFLPQSLEKHFHSGVVVCGNNVTFSNVEIRHGTGTPNYAINGMGRGIVVRDSLLTNGLVALSSATNFWLYFNNGDFTSPINPTIGADNEYLVDNTLFDGLSQNDGSPYPSACIFFPGYGDLPGFQTASPVGGALLNGCVVRDWAHDFAFWRGRNLLASGLGFTRVQDCFFENLGNRGIFWSGNQGPGVATRNVFGVTAGNTRIRRAFKVLGRANVLPCPITISNNIITASDFGVDIRFTGDPGGPQADPTKGLQPPPETCYHIVNNTLFDYDFGVEITGASNGAVLVANNIFNGSSGTLLGVGVSITSDVNAGVTMVNNLFHNNIVDVSGTPLANIGAISADPLFLSTTLAEPSPPGIPTLQGFVPDDGMMSPAVNAGDNSSYFEIMAQAGSFDVDLFQARILDGTIDIGAQETGPAAPPAPDLRVQKSGIPSPVTAGSVLRYRLNISNNGVGDAPNVFLIDALDPLAADVIAATPSQGLGCSQVGVTLTCALGLIPAGGTATVVVNVNVDPTAAGVLINTATVVSDSTDENPQDNRVTLITPVIQVADVRLVKVASADPVVAGTTMDYVLTVSNAGPSDATGVVVTDYFDSSALTVLNATATQGSGCVIYSGSVTCGLGTIPVGAFATITLTVDVDPGAMGPLVNSATATPETLDPNPDNNTDTITTPVVLVTDLGITKSDFPDPILQGGVLTYQILVGNQGPSDAVSVLISDMLPAGVMVITATASQGAGCAPITGGVECDLGALAVGSIAEVTLVVQLDALTVGAITNSVEAIPVGSTDPNPEDNIDTEDTTVLAPTPTVTNTPTNTPTSTPTATFTSTPTFTPSNTPSNTPTSTPTFTPTQSFTPTATFTPTSTATPTSTFTSTPTFTPTSTPTPTNTRPLCDDPYYILDILGGRAPVGGPPPIVGPVYFGIDAARDLESARPPGFEGGGTSDGLDLVVLDKFGAAHFVQFPVVIPQDFYFDDDTIPQGRAMDLEIAPDSQGFWVLTDFGGIYRAGSAKQPLDPSLLPNLSLPVMLGYDIPLMRQPGTANVNPTGASLRAVALGVIDNGGAGNVDGYLVMDSQGGRYHLNPDGSEVSAGTYSGTPVDDPRKLLDPAEYVWPFFPGLDIARDLELHQSDRGLIIFDGWGGIHPVPVNVMTNPVYFARGDDPPVMVGLPYIVTGFDDPLTEGVDEGDRNAYGIDAASIFADLHFCSDGLGFYTLDRFGAVFTYGSTRLDLLSVTPMFTDGPYFFPNKFAVDLESVPRLTAPGATPTIAP